MTRQRWLIVLEDLPCEDDIGHTRRLWLCQLDQAVAAPAVQVRTVDELFDMLLVQQALHDGPCASEAVAP